MRPIGIRWTLRPRTDADGKYGRIEAINIETKQVMWVARQRAPQTTGVLATAGGLVFHGGGSANEVRAYDAKPGEKLWSFKTGTGVVAAPISFELDGLTFTALNGGPAYQFNESVSFVIRCDSQEDVDYYWEKLTADGGKEIQCGWLKDRYGLSWQVVPRGMDEMFKDPESEAAKRAMAAVLKMKKCGLAHQAELHHAPGCRDLLAGMLFRRKR